MTKKEKIIPSHYSWNSSIFTRGIIDPIKRRLGYVDENEHPVSLKESANGQELNRMNDTAKKATTIAMAGLGVSSIPALARYAVSLPQIAIPEIAVGLGTGSAGAKVGEKVGQALGGDGYWGSLIGGFGVGAVGVKGLDALRSTPKIVGKGNALGYRLLKEIPKIDNRFISEIEPGNTKVIEFDPNKKVEGNTYILNTLSKEPHFTYIVNDDGSINQPAFRAAVAKFLKMFPGAKNNQISHRRNYSYQSTLEHILQTAKTAQEMPLPTGVTRRELVESALAHDIGEVVSRNEHGSISASIAKILYGASDRVQNAQKEIWWNFKT